MEYYPRSYLYYEEYELVTFIVVWPLQLILIHYIDDEELVTRRMKFIRKITVTLVTQTRLKPLGMVLATLREQNMPVSDQWHLGWNIVYIVFQQASCIMN